MKTTILSTLLIIAFLIIVGLLSATPKEDLDQQIDSVTINDHRFSVEIAETERARQRGLSGRQELPLDSGLLFIFPKPDYYPFWMKEMNFPIDIIWLDSDKKIVDITANLSPETYPESSRPQNPAQYVLEINAGLSEKLNFKIGDQAQF